MVQMKKFGFFISPNTLFVNARRENINMIFSNYLLIINLLKKEYHYLITTLKKLDSNIHEKHNSVNVLMNGLNIKNVQPVNMDSKIDIVDSDEEEKGFNLF